MKIVKDTPDDNKCFDAMPPYRDGTSQSTEPSKPNNMKNLLTVLILVFFAFSQLIGGGHCKIIVVGSDVEHSDRVIPMDLYYSLPFFRMEKDKVGLNVDKCPDEFHDNLGFPHGIKLGYQELADSLPNSMHKYALGAKWTYELTCQIPNEVSFITYEISDTFTYKGMSCYVINDADSICTLGNKVYGIDYRLTDSLQLLFDYDAVDRFSFECFELNNGISNYDIEISSKGVEQIFDGQTLDITSVSTFCNYGFFGDIEEKIYDGIGASSIAPFPCKDFCNNLSDPVFCQVGQLRCFENGDELFQFVPYSCDSVWVMTSTTDVTADAIFIYPNPASDQMIIKLPKDGAIYRISVRNISGIVVLEAPVQHDHSISIADWMEGIYFVEIKNLANRILYTGKVVKMK